MADINRTTRPFLWHRNPSEDIISQLMRLARLTFPGRGESLLSQGDPSAAWVAGTAVKPVSNGTPGTKLMSAYKIAVIETFSKEFTRDAKMLYDALIQRLPAALAAVFD